MAEQQSTYWQQDDKSTMAKLFMTIGAFAGIMAVVAIVVGIIL